MLPWMLYMMVVSLLLGGAALAAERMAQLRRAPTRWLWLLAIVASLLVPATIASVSIQLPRIPSLIGEDASQQSMVLRQMTSSALSPVVWLHEAVPQLAARPHLDTFLRSAWMAASALLLLLLLLSGVHLYWRKRGWRYTTMAGVPVYLTDDVGPAVVGLLRPRIAVPRWLTESTAECQQHVIAHERSHLQGHDTRLLTASVFLLVCMPWNLLLWWHLHRLRRAIEVDCDARVLDSGHDVRSYGETLIAVCERQSATIGVVAGMSESPTFLEQRIKIMMLKPGKRWQTAAILLGSVSFGLVAMAAQVEPPNAASPHQQIEVPAAVLDRYTGYYRFGENTILTITRDGQQLSAQLTGQTATPIYPESTASFFYKVVDAQISFVIDARGQATALVLHQNGLDHDAPRMDAALAQQMTTALQARIQSQMPMPGTEAAVRRAIQAIADGKPDYEDMSPKVADAVRNALPETQQWFGTLGPVTSLSFAGVGSRGWDTYRVMHERGVLNASIVLDKNGTIVGLWFSAEP